MRTTIELSGITIPIHLTRKRKRHLSFRFSNTVLMVSAPISTTLAEIESGLRTKERWILTHYAKNQANQLEANQLRVLGKVVSVTYETGNAFDMMLINDQLMITHKSTQSPKSALTQALAVLAEREVTAIFEVAKHHAGIAPRQMEFKNLRSSLGRCSSKKDIILARRLIHYPPEVILAVCYHELAHLVHMNHSQRFYNQLENWMPQYRRVMKNARNYPSVSTID